MLNKIDQIVSEMSDDIKDMEYGTSYRRIKSEEYRYVFIIVYYADNPLFFIHQCLFSSYKKIIGLNKRGI
jgi:hypothetical protein